MDGCGGDSGCAGEWVDQLMNCLLRTRCGCERLMMLSARWPPPYIELPLHYTFKIKFDEDLTQEDMNRPVFTVRTFEFTYLDHQYAYYLERQPE